MQKKYFSTDEFAKKNGSEPYNGYVLIDTDKGTASVYDTGEELIVSDNPKTKVNMSDGFFDRLPVDTLRLPHSLPECTFGANEFIKTSIINKIVKNIEENSAYIFKNCFMATSKLPAGYKAGYTEGGTEKTADIISLLSPIPTNITSLQDFPTTDKTKWIWSGLNYYTEDIRKAHVWPFESTDGIVDVCIAFTDKPKDPTLAGYESTTAGGESTMDAAHRLFTAFIAFKDKVRVVNLELPDYPVYESLAKDKLYPAGVIGEISRLIDPEGENPIRSWSTLTAVHPELTGEFEARLVSPTSYVNNLDGENNIKNMSVYEFNTVNPWWDKTKHGTSFVFKNITSIALNSGQLYVLDSEIPALVRYDVSRCLADRGGASNIIKLIDYISGSGTAEEPYFFDSPTSISAEDGGVCVLDKGNKVIKVYDSNTSHIVTLSHGAFSRQTPEAVCICPYDFMLDDLEIKAGAIFVCSTSGDNISFDLYDKDYTYLGNYKVNGLSIVTDYWRDENTGKKSSPIDPIYSREVIRKIVFSKNNSNYFYLVSDRRIIKFQLSRLTDGLGSLSFMKAPLIDYTFVWEAYDVEWSKATDIYGNPITWNYDIEKAIYEFPAVKCFAITDVPGENYDAVLSILDNKRPYKNGLVHRVDNLRSNRLLYYTESGMITYSYTKQPMYARIGEEVNEFENKGGRPVFIQKTFIIPEYTATIKGSIPNAIIFMREPNNLENILTTDRLNAFSNEELVFNKGNKMYFDEITLNALLYKLYYNLKELKSIITERFVAAYNLENMLIFYDKEALPQSNSLLLEKDFTIGENEPVGALLNRCFINIYNIQKKIIKDIQIKYNGTIFYDKNNYKII